MKEERREEAVEEIIKTIGAKVEVKKMRISRDRDREREMIMIGKCGAEKGGVGEKEIFERQERKDCVGLDLK